MPDCELLLTCPFFNDKTQDMSEMTEMLKEGYCRGNFAWCGRYMAFKALEGGRMCCKLGPETLNITQNSAVRVP